LHTHALHHQQAAALLHAFTSTPAFCCTHTPPPTSIPSRRRHPAVRTHLTTHTLPPCTHTRIIGKRKRGSGAVDPVAVNFVDIVFEHFITSDELVNHVSGKLVNRDSGKPNIYRTPASPASSSSMSWQPMPMVMVRFFIFRLFI
jgi:hypothetical protein